MFHFIKNVTFFHLLSVFSPQFVKSESETEAGEITYTQEAKESFQQFSSVAQTEKKDPRSF